VLLGSPLLEKEWRQTLGWTAHVPQCEPPRAVAIVLSIVAGLVDACTYLALFGLFVAQVTGSFVIIGTGLVTGSVKVAPLLAVPVSFAGGTLATGAAIIGQAMGRSPLAATLMLETALLAGFAALAGYEAPFSDAQSPSALAAAMFGLAAMGVQSALVRLLMKETASTNVMTTNTSQIAIDATQTLAALLLLRRHGNNQDPEAAQFEKSLRRLGKSWPLPFAFLAGTTAGAIGYAALGFTVLLLPTGAVAALALWATYGGASSEGDGGR
jgi:uncharacterized membrane protein YoaK (UPF0700 family)